MSVTAKAEPFPLSSPQIAALVRALNGFPQRYRERGRAYLSHGRVESLDVTGERFEAKVRGNEDYGVDWLWDDDTRDWDHDCTCPIQFECKHAYAAACAALLQAPRALWMEAGVARFVADLPAVRGARAVPPPPREVTPQRRSVVDALRSETNTWRRRDLLQKLLSRGPNRFMTAYDQPFAEILEERDADVMCWMLAQEIARQSEGWVPPGLAPYADRPDLAAKIRDRARHQLLEDLMTWASDRRVTTATRSLRFIWSLRAGWQDRVGLTIDVRLTSPKLKDERRTLHQLQQLRADAQRSGGMLPSEQRQALEAFLDSAQRYSYWSEEQRAPNEVVRSLLEQAPESSFMTWSNNLPTELAARAGIEPSSPVRMGKEAVRILPSCRAEQGQIQIELRCLWPDRSRAIEEVLHIERASSSTRGAGFVIADGKVWIVAEEPPEDLLADFQAAGSVRIDRDRWPEVIAPLAVRFSHVRQELAVHTQLHRTRSVVALALRDDDWLQARLFAHTAEGEWRPGMDWPEGMVLFEFTPLGQWRKYQSAAELIEAANAYQHVEEHPLPQAAESDSAAPPQSAPTLREDEIWAEAPDPENTEPAVQWVTDLTAGASTARAADATEPIDLSTGWWAQATRKRMELFAALWEERPKSVTYVGNERIRRLLAQGHTVRPRVRVSTTGIDWFGVTADWEAEGRKLTDADLAKLRAADTRFVKLSSGWVRKEEVEAHDEAAALLADLGIEIGGSEQRLTLWQLAQVSDSSIQQLEALGADPQTAEAVRQLRRGIESFGGVPAVDIPQGFRGELRPYQQRGLEFLAYVSGLGLGVILADDMGLGKTLQALLWVLHLRQHQPGGGPTLVVCPTSVMHNWLREAEQFTPELKVLLLGSGAERHEQRKEVDKYDVVVTNYALLRRDIEAWREIKLRAVVMDEAQNIKNPDAAVSRAAGELQAQYRLALTGTPLENRPLDLWSIMNFVNPGYLGSRTQFSGSFDRVDAPPHTRALLAAKLRPVLLRRLKKEVAQDLPDRIEERQDCLLTEGQRQLYLAELRRSRKLVDDLSSEPGGIRNNKIQILAALTRLRQICCHPALGGGDAELGSGKFDAVFELLEPLLAEGHKVLLFSQFVQCLRLLEKELRSRSLGYHLLTGQSTKREQIVRRFQEDPDPSVFLISLKAGGTGLNLTAASYVVLFDPWWNPAVEAQAIDRTHRIGQDRTVIAYKMIASGTIEEKIWELQQRKAAMVRDVLGEDGFARSLTKEDLQFLLTDPIEEPL
ncbi:MAG TPA: DEAD/DEAH box helicase [Terriglobales bacterium]|nr:DEAD/DEAH box helicase [Terriglobales bacterium]